MIKIGRWCNPCRAGSSHPISLSLRVGFAHPNTRIHVRLLGPCFKTGRLKPFCQTSLYCCVNRSVSSAVTTSATELHNQRRRAYLPLTFYPAVAKLMLTDHFLAISSCTRPKQPLQHSANDSFTQNCIPPHLAGHLEQLTAKQRTAHWFPMLPF